MNTPEMQQLKMAWLAAKEAGDTSAQMRLLHEHPDELEELTDFIAAYHAAGGSQPVDLNAPVLALTQRASQRALDRVFSAAAQVATIAELRKQRNLTKVAAAKDLHLSVEVWNKFETGIIEINSLTRRQMERLASFFQVSIDQFSNLLLNSQPELSFNRRQTQQAAGAEQQGPRRQSFTAAIEHSTMSANDKKYWLDA